MPGSGQGSIQGSVYLDGNRDGRRNPVTEAGLANVRLTLYDRNRVELARTVTDARGNYSFGDLPPGIYVVVETDPTGYVSTSANILTVVLRSSTPASGIDFGDDKHPSRGRTKRRTGLQGFRCRRSHVKLQVADLLQPATSDLQPANQNPCEGE